MPDVLLSGLVARGPGPFYGASAKSSNAHKIVASCVSSFTVEVKTSGTIMSTHLSGVSGHNNAMVCLPTGVCRTTPTATTVSHLMSTYRNVRQGFDIRP
jgi:hypothetical protein